VPRLTPLIPLLLLSFFFSGCSAAPRLQQDTGVPALPVTASPQATALPAPVRTFAPTRTLPAATRASPPSETIMATRKNSPPNPTIPLPDLSLRPGDFYFSSGGQRSFFFLRNLGGNQVGQYLQLLDRMKGQGSQVVRIQLDSLGMG
jgi:hypothetical protein